jgi:sulfur relay (sulfurtransferase) DsrC/TusE family protein
MENDMTRIARKPVLTEVLSSKDDLITPQEMRAYNHARKEWEQIATTNAGEYAVIAAAQSGEESAKLFLLYKLFKSGPIKDLLWKFLGPNPTYQRQRIADGDTGIYKSIVSVSLEQILKRWNLDYGKEEGGEKKASRREDYFYNFFFQVTKRVNTNTRKYNVEQNRGGMAGKVLKGEKEPEISSYEAHTTDASGKPSEKNEFETKHNPFKETDAFTAWETFIDDPSLDRGPSPTPRQVLKYLLSKDMDEFDAKEAGRQFGGVSHVTIYSRLASMKPALDKAGLDQTGFAQLIQKHGRDLATTL